MSKIKNQILNLFLDNIVNDITPSDMRIFVNAIFDNKENNIRKLSTLASVEKVYPTPIIDNDLVIIIEDGDNNGIYLVLNDNPTQADLMLIAGSGTGAEYIETLSQGQNNQILSFVDDELVWIDQNSGYTIVGTKRIQDILVLRPAEINTIYIAENSDHFSYLPGLLGDGYSWDGSIWNNIGQLRGPEGPATDLSNFDGISQLEKVTENGLTGWRILGRDTLFFADIGDSAIDLSYSDGTDNGASGEKSFTTGYNTTAAGIASSAFGEGTKTTKPHAFVVGKYNQDNDTILEVGIGTEATPLNAFEIYPDGRILAPNFSIDQQKESVHSFVTKGYIDVLIVDCKTFL